jgi:hypothetical protein
MASTIVFRRGNTFPSQGSGITLAEPVFNTSQNTFHIGLGHGVTAEWVGAPITGLSASIASGEAYKIPTAAAVKNYISGLCFGNTGAPTITQYVSSFNGLTGAVQGVSSAAAGTGISVSAATGAITITNTGVQSFNGTTGAVQGVSAAVAGTGISVSGTTGSVTITNTGVQSFNGTTGAVQGVSAAVAGTGISVSGTTGSVTITNTGVQSFNGTTGAVQGVRYVNGKTGDIVILGGTNIGVSTSGQIVTVNNEGVLSVDGSTGAVNNVARTNTANTFTQLQTFSNASGISASQVITKTVQLPGNQSNLTLTGSLFSDSVGIRLFSTDGLGGDYHTTVKGSVLSADRTITFPDTTGTVALTSQLMGAVNGSTAATTAVISFNGLTGAVGITAGTNVTITQSGNTLTISSSGGSSITDYVVSFNGLTGAVQGVSAAVAGTGISVSGATGAVTITNTGVQSFNGSTGAVSFVNYVSSFNGSSGSVGISAGTGISITQSGTTYTIASTVSSGISRSIINVTGATTAGSASSVDYVYNGTSGPYAITMPTAVSNTNRYTIKNSGTGAISIYTTSSQTIDGITFYNLNKQYSAIDLMSNGSNWFIV